MIKIPDSPVKVKHLIFHGLYTPPYMDPTKETIEGWQKEKGFDEIGYNWLITRQPKLIEGRSTHIAGAHTLGEYNLNSLSCVLTGGKAKNGDRWDFNYTLAQLTIAQRLIHAVKQKYPDIEVCGHRDKDNRRECPGFDVKSVLCGNAHPWAIYG